MSWPAQADVPARTFVVTDYGAIADGRTVNTDAFRNAIAAVNGAGGGRLLVTAGIYLTGPIDLCSRIDLHLDPGATILFSTDAPAGADGRRRPLLLARDAHDVVVSGKGTINGNGDYWWHLVQGGGRKGRVQVARPRMVVFDHCVRVRIEGVTLTHSPEFNLVPMFCQDVTIRGINIYNPADDLTQEDGIAPEVVRSNLEKAWADQAPNTDGIDPMVSQRVLIAGCLIDTGDDGIAIKADKGGVTEDIVIRDCTFLHGHGCTIGSGERGGLRNVTVRNCTFQGCDVGINFESARDRGSLIENIDVSDITMTGVGEAIMLCDYYPNGALIVRSKSTQAFNDLVNGQRDSAQPITSTTPRWRNISIRNVDATCIWEAGLILGLPEMPIENIHLHDVRISAPEGLHISYVKGITLDDVQIFAKRGPPLMVSETVEGLKRD